VYVADLGAGTPNYATGHVAIGHLPVQKGELNRKIVSLEPRAMLTLRGQTNDNSAEGNLQLERGEARG